MDPGAVPTYRLTERTTAECLLTPDDVDFLLEAHRAHIKRKMGFTSAPEMVRAAVQWAERHGV